SGDLMAQGFERMRGLRLGRALWCRLLCYGYFACSFVHFSSSSRIGLCVVFEKSLYCAHTVSARGSRNTYFGSLQANRSIKDRALSPCAVCDGLCAGSVQRLLA